MSIFKHVPAGYTLRPVQQKALQAVQDNWHKYDVIVLRAPVAAGKSLISMTISNWVTAAEGSTALLTPQVMLQDQYVSDFPDIPSLKGMSRYSCHIEGIDTCEDRYLLDDRHCADCPYDSACTKTDKAPVAIYNLYSYWFGRGDYKQTLIVDEAHAVLSQMKEIYSIKIYHDEDGYPKTAATQGDFMIWLESRLEQLATNLQTLQTNATETLPADATRVRQLKQKIIRYRMLYEAIDRSPGHFFYEEKTDNTRGKSRRYIHIRPITLEHCNVAMWRKHKKIVLMSATLFDRDIKDMGFGNKRVLVVECESPIPVANRPIFFEPVAKMSMATQDIGIPMMAARINELLPNLPGKGIIHTTYSMAPKLAKLLTDPRFMFHTKTNKVKVYEEFRASTEPKVLVACGMSEGIDLVGAEFQWQVITKIAFPDLGDQLVQRQKAEDPSWYAQEAIRTLVQQSGRICRTPTDYGATYIFDSAFRFLVHRDKRLFPAFFLAALVMPTAKNG